MSLTANWQQKADRLALQTHAFINGQFVAATDNATLPCINPATREKLADVACCDENDVNAAVAAAKTAFKSGIWSRQSPAARKTILLKLAELLVEKADELALADTLDMGKPIAETTAIDVPGAIDCLRWTAEAIDKIYGEIAPTDPSALALISREPVGVVAAITPWNFPTAMITRKCAPAMAAGCPFVVKPAPDTPYSALALAVLAEEAGVPAGIFNVVTGDAIAIGGELTGNDKVRKLSFTGSTNIGKLLMRQCADTVKKVCLELGGNAPFIVFDDADLDAAVAGALASKYRNAGQTCVCTNRFLIQDGIYDQFVEKLTAAVNGLKVGNGMDEGVTQGPMINAAAVEKIEDHLSDAVSKGATITTGGKRHDLGGSFFEPTVICNVTTEMKVAREETFGPLAPIFRFSTEEEAIAMGNDTEFGLAAYVYTKDLGRAWRTGEGLDYGMVGINEGIISTTVAPFGGVKQSGIGREGSKYGIDDYVEIKYMMMGGI